MTKETPSIKKALADSKSVGNALRIHLPEVTVTKAGTNVSITASKPTPVIHVPAVALKSAPGTKYIIVSIDIDPPFPSFSVLGPALHGLHADLVAGPVDADGFAPLQGAEEWVVPYVGPGPPPPSAAHRYLFMVFEQPRGLDSAGVRRVLSLPGEVGIMARMRWDTAGAERKMGLGEVIAANYFLTHA